jgi:hypothetical protein
MASGDDQVCWNKYSFSDMMYLGSGWKRVTTADAFKSNVSTIVSDSMCQNIMNMVSTGVQCVHGGYLRDFPMYCQYGAYDLRDFLGILFVYGTNDISRYQSRITLIASLDNAVRYTRNINPLARIGVSSILPRPVDVNNPVMQAAWDAANGSILDYCSNNNILHVDSCTMLNGRNPTIPCFRNDGIHLSDPACIYFKTYLDGKMGVLIGSPPQTPTQAAAVVNQNG